MVKTVAGLVISYVNQDTSFLKGAIKDFCKNRELDEPLNYIDVFSRMQIEKLLMAYQPTMLLVEHDVQFREKVSTGIMDMEFFTI